MLNIMLGFILFEKMRIGHIHYYAVVVMVLFLSFFLYPGTRRIDPNSTFLSVLHLGAFASQYGAQLWVTMVAGVTMFCSLPRRMFGQVQKRLFPMFFFWGYVTSAVILATFLLRHPLDTWRCAQYIEICALSASFVSSTTNLLVLSPLIVSTMLKTFELEVNAGVGDLIGYAKIQELQVNQEYVSTYKTFRRCHGVSAGLTVLSLIANSIHLYYLACQCMPVAGLVS